MQEAVMGSRSLQLFSPSSGLEEDSLLYRNLAACRMDRTARPVQWQTKSDMHSMSTLLLQPYFSLLPFHACTSQGEAYTWSAGCYCRQHASRVYLQTELNRP